MPSFDGGLQGSIDYLSPIYDSEATTVFTQLGLRTMPGERVIGNFGLGQRHFFDQMALGYNVFIDQDFTRKHLRGGLGLEVWYDWLRVASNYYLPLSKWQPSKDFNSEYFQERPAEGFDFRLTGYLPFYRHLAISAAMEQWSGEFVAPFGQSSRLSSNPMVIVGGIGWTPFPLLTVSGEARRSDGHTEARMGLSLNYHFGVPLKDQLASSAVEELTTVDGSRHDFVQRQNEMILEYRANPDKLLIRLRRVISPTGVISYIITFTDVFGNPIPNLSGTFS